MAGIIIFWCVAGAAVGYAIGAQKGRGGEGLVLGLLLGVIGWIIIAVMQPAESQTTSPAVSATSPPNDLRPCPYCAERIQPEAIVCRFCGRDVQPAAPRLPVDRIETIRARFPAFFDEAQTALAGLPNRPEDEPEWLETVCAALRSGRSLKQAVAEATPAAY